MNKLIRFLEIFPGAVTWFCILVPIVASFFLPAFVAIFVLIFDLYWLYKALIMGVHLIWGYRNMRQADRIDWLKLCQDKLEENRLPGTIDWRKIYNVIILATYKEGLGTLLPSTESVVQSTFPNNRTIFVLATEERDKENAFKISEELKKRFASKLFGFLVTIHPGNLPGEVPGKGSNATWAAKELRKFLDQHQIKYDQVIVSTADADTRIHHQYLTCLTYKFCSEPDRIHRSFQPIPIYNNNIWDAPAISRIIAFGNSFWQMIEATRPWRLINFSTHAMSFQTLIDIDYWALDVVNEDSRQFWRAYFRYDGNHHVIPIFVPVYMDAVLADSFWETIKEQYLQKKRWAYGVEHFPYVVIESWRHKKISRIDRLIKIYRLFEANWSWATASIYITIIAWLPLYFNANFHSTVLAANMPTMMRVLLSLTWIGLFISVTISTILLPPRPAKYGKLKMLSIFAQWLLIPIQAIIFNSFPAIESQTRLMLGKYLTFRVTQKKSV